MSTLLIQSEADALRTMPKQFTRHGRTQFSMPHAGEGMTFELESLDRRTAFLIDVNRRGRIKLSRCSYLERYRVVDILARLDIDGPPHTNPMATTSPLSILSPYNGATVVCPHFHMYVEGYEDKWAIPAEVAGFNQTSDLVAVLREFMTHCGVQEVPNIQYLM